MSEPTAKQYTRAALSPFAGVHLASGIVSLYQENKRDFGRNLYTEEITNFKFATFIMFTFLETIIFFLLGLYFEYVWPSQIGLKHHPCFCCVKKNPVPEIYKPNSMQSENKYNIEDYEPLPQYLEKLDEGLLVQREQNKTLTIKNVRKKFKDGKIAVHNLSLEMYTDQIFALLGHNGAGKSTTISMISGLYAKSAGIIKILGYDNAEDPDKVRQIMGICPQTNPLYPMLTCEEHLELYGKIKGYNNSKLILEESDKLLNDIDLYHKKTCLAGILSGGQKRKLCVALSLMADSKIVLLDEPTSGMDTYARRHLWEMLKLYKKDKLIILTTHYMDEADFLGDRVGIMGDGKLLTCGSSLFLKQKFGCGYDLTVVKTAADIPSLPIEKIVAENCENMKSVGDIGMELKFQLPVESAHKFQKIFKTLEDDKNILGIQTFGVSLTTLEEVFLKVAHLGDPGLAIKQTSNIYETEMQEQKIKEKQDDVIHDINNKELKDLQIKSGMFAMHFKALLKKRMIYFRKDIKGLFCELFIPMMVVLLGLALTKIQFMSNKPNLLLQPEWGPPNYDFYSGYLTASTGWSTVFNSLASTQSNITQLTECQASATSATTFQSCLLTNTPTGKTENVFD